MESTPWMVLPGRGSTCSTFGNRGLRDGALRDARASALPFRLNRLEAKGVKLNKGTKVVATVATASRKLVTVRFAIE